MDVARDLIYTTWQLKLYAAHSSSVKLIAAQILVTGKLNGPKYLVLRGSAYDIILPNKQRPVQS